MRIQPGMRFLHQNDEKVRLASIDNAKTCGKVADRHATVPGGHGR